MKKWIIAILIVASLIASFYLFIPGAIIIQRSVLINISQYALRRLLIENPDWTKGWTQKDSSGTLTVSGQSVQFEGYKYTATDRKYSSIILLIAHEKDSMATASLTMVEVSRGVVKFDWETSLPTSVNPVKRIQMYLQAKKIDRGIGVLLNKIKDFYSKPVNVYGISIHQEPVMDTTLLFISDTTHGYPKTELIYSLVDKLRNYIGSHQAQITGYPMLNIYTSDSSLYLVKVALPVDRELPSNGKIGYKWMLPNGNILVAEVKGGAKTIENGFRQMEYFIKDYGRDSPAIPFVSLVTDRRMEKDTSKWITRIYYPVME